MAARDKAKARIAEERRVQRDRVRLLRLTGDTEGVGLPTTGSNAPGSQGGGGGIDLGSLGGVLKDVGGTALKVLSVPSAAVETGVTNLLASTGVGRAQSWKDLAGEFSKTYRPGEGYASIAESAGLPKGAAKWAGFGTSIVADPLWFVGGGLVRNAAGAAGVEKRIEAGLKLRDLMPGSVHLQSNRVDRMLDAVAEGVHGQRLSRQGTAAVRFGTRRHGVSVPIGIPVSAKPIDLIGVEKAPQHLRDVRGGLFRTNPLHDVYHRLHEAASGAYFDRVRGQGGRFPAMPIDDVRKLVEEKADEAFMRYVDRHIPTIDAKGAQGIAREIKAIGTPRSTLAQSRLAKGYRDTVSVMKGLYTIPRPAHFVRNAFGSYLNHLGVATASTAASHSWQEAWRLSHQVKAGENLPILLQRFNVAGKELTGAELILMQRMMGMGSGGMLTRARILEGTGRAETGDLNTELSQAANILDRFFTPGKGVIRRPFGAWYRLGRDLNITRDDAQRIHDWFAFIKAGDDPFEAASKVIRSQFDYGHATDFERRVMRQFVMFYTWSRKNIPYQVSLLATRPGYMSALNKATYPAEGMPDYARERFGFNTPVGRFNVGAPIQDLMRLQLDARSARANIGTSLNPVVRYPLERALNQDFFTGKPLGEVRPRYDPFAAVALKLGIPGAAMVRPFKGEAPVPNWTSADVDHFVRSFLGGPLPSDVGRLNDSSYNLRDATLGTLGISPMGGARDRRKWKASLKAQADARKKKAPAYRKPVK